MHMSQFKRKKSVSQEISGNCSRRVVASLLCGKVFLISRLLAASFFIKFYFQVIWYVSTTVRVFVVVDFIIRPFFVM